MSSEVDLSRPSNTNLLPDSVDEEIVLDDGNQQSFARELSDEALAKDIAKRDFNPVQVDHEPYEPQDGEPVPAKAKPGFAARVLGLLRRDGSGDAKSSRSDGAGRGKLAANQEKRPFLESVLGANARERRVRILLVLFCALLIASLSVLWTHLSQSERIAEVSALVGEGITQVQQTGTALSGAMTGDEDAVKASGESQGRLSVILDDLEVKRALGQIPQEVAPTVATLRAAWDSVDPALTIVIDNRRLLRNAAQARNDALLASTPMLASAEAIVDQKLKPRRPSAKEVARAGDLAVQTQRVAKETAMRLSPDSEMFGQPGDLLATVAAFEGTLVELTGRSQTTRRYADQIRGQLENFAPQLDAVLSKGQTLQAVQQASFIVSKGTLQMKNAFADLRQKLAIARHDSGWLTLAAAALGLLTAFCALALSRAYMVVSNARTSDAMHQKDVAEKLQAEAKRTNDQNQAAILRLMNELQEVADGDLTVQATVSEDITGAIADSVNYTVEELRSLVSRINSTAGMVSAASRSAHVQMANLQKVSQTQFVDMKKTGQSVLAMARQINEVSERASDSVTVARQSVSASKAGSSAVNNAITGMNAIRDQIQDTAKRIKRLGESSQEIGEIVEVISDLSEQTNVLALNAAIQAASAGEAGRGFTIVAEEVQRLAERSADASKQIAGLIKTIQTDTHDAVAAMERSTEEVVAGTKRSDEAGNALEQIGQVSTQLAEMIEGFSETTSEQAASAGTVARSIHNILLVTKQSAEGTIQTAGAIQQLSTLSDELKDSVARFKVG